MGKVSGVRPKMADPVEVYWPNANYGNHLALKRHARYSLKDPVWAVIPHGVFYEDDYVFEGEAKARVPAVLNWPEHRDAVWGQHKIVVPCAAPFLYALGIYPHAKERKGTLVMPQHTTTLFDMEFDWWEFADRLEGLPKPITVLLYYNDAQQDVHRYFSRYRVRTCGHVNDPNFLEKLVGYLTGAELVVSNEVGSYTQYATAAGARFRLLGDPPRFVLNEQGKELGFEGIFHNSEDRHPEEKRRIAEIDALYRDHDFDEPITKDQLESMKYYLRFDALKDSAGLHADLEFCRDLHNMTKEQRIALMEGRAVA